jgi:hypothetical protein
LLSFDDDDMYRVVATMFDSSTLSYCVDGSMMPSWHPTLTKTYDMSHTSRTMSKMVGPTKTRAVRYVPGRPMYDRKTIYVKDGRDERA